MSDFSKSVKDALARVFGRGDLEEVLSEEWEFTDTQSLQVDAGVGEPRPAPPTPPPGITTPAGPADLKALATTEPARSRAPSFSGSPPPSPPSTPPFAEHASDAPPPAHETSELIAALDPSSILPDAEASSVPYPPTVSSTTTAPNESRVNPLVAGSADTSSEQVLGTIELPGSATHEEDDELSRAVQLFTEEGPLPETESFIAALGFGGADSPYPADLTELEAASASPADELPEAHDTLDITGIFDAFLADEGSSYDGAPETDDLQRIGELEPPVRDEDIPIDEPPPLGEASGQQPQEHSSDPTDDLLSRFSDGEMPLDEFADALAGAPLAGLDAPHATDAPPIHSSVSFTETAPPVIESTVDNDQLTAQASSGSEFPAASADSGPQDQAAGTSNESDAQPNEEDSLRVYSQRGRAMFQRASGSSKQGPPPDNIMDELGTRRSIAKGLRRDAQRSKNHAFRKVLTHLAGVVEAETADLPTFPDAAQRLLAIQEEDAVMEIVRSSPSLAGNVLKVANSPFYMSAKPVSTLNAAMMRIGIDQVRRVSLASLVGASYHAEGFEGVISKIQLHSIATATAAELIATHFHVAKEEAFLGGLLHDAGMVLTYRLMGSSNAAIDHAWEVDNGTMRRLARKYHQRLGALLLGGWDLAPSVATMMAFHHHPDLADEEFQTYAKLIHIADAIAERAVTHSKNRKWLRALTQRQPDASPEELARLGSIDGVTEIDVSDLLLMGPHSLDIIAMHGVIRGVLLKLDSRRDEEGLGAGPAAAT